MNRILTPSILALVAPLLLACPAVEQVVETCSDSSRGDDDDDAADGELQTVAEATNYRATAKSAEVVRFVEGKRVCCARCKSQLREGDAVVYCPACRAAHHEACFHYAPHCAMCPAPTEGFSWVPEPLEKSNT